MIGLGAYGLFLIGRAVISPERADPNLKWARHGLPLPLSVDNVVGGTALGLAGYSPGSRPSCSGSSRSGCRSPGTRSAARWRRLDFIPRINTDLLTGIAFAALAVLMALGVTLPLSGD